MALESLTWQNMVPGLTYRSLEKSKKFRVYAARFEDWS